MQPSPRATRGAGLHGAGSKSGAEAVARSAARALRSDPHGSQHAGHGRLRRDGADPQRRRARTDSARVPIVALTAHDAVRLSREVPGADMDDILSKPYTLDDCRDCCAAGSPRRAKSTAAARRVAAAGADGDRRRQRGLVRTRAARGRRSRSRGRAAPVAAAPGRAADCTRSSSSCSARARRSRSPS